MGQAKARGTYEERVQRAQADERARVRMRECNERMRQRMYAERLAAQRAQEIAAMRERADRLGVRIVDDHVPIRGRRVAHVGGMGMHFLAAAIALAAPLSASLPAVGEPEFERFREKFDPRMPRRKRGY